MGSKWVQSWKFYLLGSLLAIHAQLVWASNFHEHLYSFSPFDDLAVSYETVVAGRTFAMNRSKDYIQTFSELMEKFDPRKQSEVPGKVMLANGLYASAMPPEGTIIAGLRYDIDSDVIEGYLQALGELKPGEILYKVDPERQREIGLRMNERMTGKRWVDIVHEVQEIGGRYPRKFKMPALGEVPFLKLAKSDPLTFLRDLFGDDVMKAYFKNEHLSDHGIFELDPPTKAKLAAARKELLEKIRNTSLYEVASRLKEAVSNVRGVPATTDLVVRSFFEFSPLNRTDASSYQAIEAARKALLKHTSSLGPGYVESLLSNMVVRTFGFSELSSIVNGKEVVSISVPDEYFNLQTLREMSIKKVTHSSGTEKFDKVGQTQFIYSIPRSRLGSADEDEFQSKLSRLRQGLKEGWAAGVDITGSIDEASFVNTPELAPQYEKRLAELIKICGQEGAFFQVHMYEGAREGTFYDALSRVFEDFASHHDSEHILPRVIGIGHVAQISDQDIQKLARLQKTLQGRTQFVFEVSPDSNFATQKTNMKRLVHIIETLDQKGFPVLLGSDGFGILGEQSSFFNTLRRLLDAGLSPGTATRMIDSNILRDLISELRDPKLLPDGYRKSFPMDVLNKIFYDSNQGFRFSEVHEIADQTILKKYPAYRTALKDFRTRAERVLLSPEYGFQKWYESIEEHMNTSPKTMEGVHIFFAEMFDEITDGHIVAFGEQKFRSRVRMVLEAYNRPMANHILSFPLGKKFSRTRKLREIVLSELQAMSEREPLKGSYALLDWYPSSEKNEASIVAIQKNAERSGQTFAVQRAKSLTDKTFVEGGIFGGRHLPRTGLSFDPPIVENDVSAKTCFLERLSKLLTSMVSK